MWHAITHASLFMLTQEVSGDLGVCGDLPSDSRFFCGFFPSPHSVSFDFYIPMTFSVSQHRSTFLRIHIRGLLRWVCRVTSWLMTFFKACCQALPCLELYWSQKFACHSDSLCRSWEVMSHWPTFPVTHLLLWWAEWRWSLCGIIKPRKMTLKFC